MQGYLSLHRKITDNEFYFSERFTKMQAWIDLLILATHQKKILFIRHIQITLQPGELCYSMFTLSKRWKWNERTVKRFLNELGKREMIQCNFTNVTTIITVKNWQEYQESRNETVKKSKEIQSKLQSKVHLNKNVDNKDKDITATLDIEKRKKQSVIFAGAMIYSKLVNGINSLPESADYSYIGTLLKLKEADNIPFRLKNLMLCYAIRQSVKEFCEKKASDVKGYLFNKYRFLNTATFKKALSNNITANQNKVFYKTGLHNSHLD